MLHAAIFRDIVCGIAELEGPAAEPASAAKLLLKAVRGLPEGEQETVLTQLITQALGARPEPLPEQFEGAGERSGVPAPQPGSRPWSPPPPPPSSVVQALGSVAGGMLLLNAAVADVASLCAITEDDVRDALREVSSGKGAPEAVKTYLRLLADGRSSAQARRTLKLTRGELAALREDPATAKLELRLGRALLTRSQQLQALRALTTYVPTSFGPPAGALPAPMATPAPHDMIRRLLLAGQDVERIALNCGIRVDAARAALHETAAHPDAKEPLASILRLIGDGRSHAEAATELGLSQTELSAALEPLGSSPLQHKLAHAFSTAAVARPLVGAVAGSERRKVVGSGALGHGAQQVVPVRFPEAQHQRLKDWCTTHGFSMAVVVRGLVERFLDDQERRAA